MTSSLGIIAVLVFGVMQVFGKEVPVWLWAIAISLAIRDVLELTPWGRRRPPPPA